MRPRFGVIGLWHETNTYSSTVTSLDDFGRFELAAGEELAQRNLGTGSVIGGFLSWEDADLVPVFSAGAWPSGPTDEAVLDSLLERIGEGLRRTGRLDGVLVNLHGAMVSTATDDVELAVLRVVRETVGELPLGVVLDLHANPSADLIAAGDVFVSYDTFPHVDMFERGREVAGLLTRVARGERLRTSLRKVPLLVSPLVQSTDVGPLATVQAKAVARADTARLDRVSVVGGFAYSDVARAGMTVLAIHDDDHAADAIDVLAGVVDDITDSADDFLAARDDVPTAVRKAIASTRTPVFLVDVADNIGGGSPGDGTALLAELLAQGAEGAVVTIADAAVAREAWHRGPGKDIRALLGGKTDSHHGAPVPIAGRVLRVSDGWYRSEGYYMRGQSFTMGATAVLQVEGVTVIVTEHPTPPFHSEQLSSVGVDASQASIVVMKGALAWRGAYPGVPGEIIEVATPGITPVDVSTLPRRTSPVTV